MSREDHGATPSEKAADHIEHIRSYTEREVAKVQEHIAGIEALSNVTTETIGLLKEFIRVGVSNPIVGAAAAIIIANLMRKAKVIDSNAEGLVDGIAVSVVGVSLAIDAAAEVSNIIDSLNPTKMFEQQTTPPSPLQPTAQVVVFGNDPSKITRALSGQLVPEAHYLAGGNE